MNLNNAQIAVIGLGYVGFPLCVEFGKHRSVVGFDVKKSRIADLQAGNDRTFEVSQVEIRSADKMVLTSDPGLLKSCGVFIVTVPTPVDIYKRPNLTSLEAACETVGTVMQYGAVVIFESTVYPGATEEVCVPLLEKYSGLKFNQGFFCGYSPERINPGDKSRRLTAIQKLTSGSTPEVADAVDALYAQIIAAGTHKASSIKVAEAAKVIENTQRDVNIALMNELALIFGRMGIDTQEVLEAAGTKWNFLPFRPGLVGGHCIGVDPYYLTYKAQEMGYHPEMILAGRRINDSMANYVADQVVKLMLHKLHNVLGSKVLVLGLTFKENCPDLRNTKVVDMVRALEQFKIQVDVYDPWINLEDAMQEYGLECLAQLPLNGKYAAVVLAVAHKQFLTLGAQGIKSLALPDAVIFDVKSLYPLELSDGRL